MRDYRFMAGGFFMVDSALMRTTARISRGGQISVPASVRRRWNTSRVFFEDRGSEIVIKPAPDDPISALRGAFVDRDAPSTDELRRSEREDSDLRERARNRD